MKNEKLVRAIFFSQSKCGDIDSHVLMQMGAYTVVLYFSFFTVHFSLFLP